MSLAALIKQSFITIYYNDSRGQRFLFPLPSLYEKAVRPWEQV